MIRRKTHSLTQSHARNDLINRQIKGFSFCNLKNKAWCSRGDFFLFSLQNLDFNHSLENEMSLEEAKKREIPRLSSLNNLIC